MKIKKLEKEKFSWLKNSDFYPNIDLEDRKIHVIYCSIQEQHINKFLDVTDFWGVNYYPIEFYTLLFKTKPIKKLNEFYKRSHSLKNNN